MNRSETGLSEVLDEILMVALVVGIAIVIIVMFMGVIPNVQRSAYLVPAYSIANSSGHQSIAVFHRNGDEVSFSNNPPSPYVAIFYIDTPSGSNLVAFDPAITPFRPGDTVYIYYTGTGFAVTDDPSATLQNTLPFSTFTVRMVDATTHSLISQYEFSPSQGTTTTTPTATATSTSTISPTPTASPTPLPYSVTISWTPNGLGDASLSPPSTLTNPQTVGVTAGSSLTVSFVPKSNKSVKTITLDGGTVYSGSTTGATISYTVTNILGPHTLAATFG
nr:hypothetical protein [uncultured Methanoregula sp.]